MNTLSASPSDAAPAGAARPAASRRVLVWDAPVRVFHWLAVFSFAGAWLSADSERWRLLHVTLGYTFAGLLAFRLVWGLAGTRHARFAGFVRGPRAVVRYLRSLAGPRPEHHVGHNPAAAWAIVALLALGALVTASGWATDQDLGGEWLEELHEGAANVMLALVLVHVAGVVFASWRHHENLVGAMFSGRKAGAPHDAIASAWRTVAMLMVVAVTGFWWLQWRDAPAGGAFADRPAAAAKAPAGEHDDD